MEVKYLSCSQTSDRGLDGCSATPPPGPVSSARLCSSYLPVEEVLERRLTPSPTQLLIFSHHSALQHSRPSFLPDPLCTPDLTRRVFRPQLSSRASLRLTTKSYHHHLDTLNKTSTDTSSELHVSSPLVHAWNQTHQSLSHAFWDNLPWICRSQRTREHELKSSH